MAINWNRSIGWNLDRATVKITQRIYDGCDCYPWRKTFAIWPVKTVGGKYVWMKSIYKRKFWVVWGPGIHIEPEVEYGDIFDILTNDNT